MANFNCPPALIPSSTYRLSLHPVDITGQQKLEVRACSASCLSDWASFLFNACFTHKNMARILEEKLKRMEKSPVSQLRQFWQPAIIHCQPISNKWMNTDEFNSKMTQIIKTTLPIHRHKKYNKRFFALSHSV